MSSVLPTASGDMSLGLLGCNGNSRAERSPQVGNSQNQQAPRQNSSAIEPRHQQEPPKEVTAAGQQRPVPTQAEERPAERHRVARVRQQQGISQRTMARRMAIDIQRYRQLENPARDLTLSELADLQVALDVPLIDLLEDRQALSRPVEERAKLVKIMKTAVALRENKVNSRVDRMCEMLCEQLIDLMPELEEVGGWPQFGARRGNSAIGKALQQPVDMSQLRLYE